MHVLARVAGGFGEEVCEPGNLAIQRVVFDIRVFDDGHDEWAFQKKLRYRFPRTARAG